MNPLYFGSVSPGELIVTPHPVCVFLFFFKLKIILRPDKVLDLQILNLVCMQSRLWEKHGVGSTWSHLFV